MKKKTLQLDKKLVLHKESIAALNPDMTSAIQGGASVTPCFRSIQCPPTKNAVCDISRFCRTQNVICKISRDITPGCG